MASINISDLRPTGSELFFDSECYMNDLTDLELNTINGGALPVLAVLSVKVASKYVLGAMASGAVVGGVAAFLD